MKNKVELKKTIIKTLIISIVLMIVFSVINILEYNSYQKNYNTKVNAIINEVKQKCPELSENEIADIVNAENSSKDYFRDYGYNINKESIILKNKELKIKYIVIEVLIVTIIVMLINAEYLRFNHKKNKDINEITKLINQINNRNYELKIDECSEDELSILKSEIYKTTLLLREETDNSVNDKFLLSKVNCSINFLNSNSLPLVIISYIEVFSSSALVINASIVFSPIPLFGVFITLSKLISSLGLFITLK